MSQLLLEDLPETVATALNKRAATNGRTPEAEARAILGEMLGVKPGSEDFWERAAEWREKLRGRHFTPSEVLIREMRDER